MANSTGGCAFPFHPGVNADGRRHDRAGHTITHRLADREWAHRDEWVTNRDSNVFRVMVSRHNKQDGNGWAVYAIIFPEHRLFRALLAAHQAGTPYYEVEAITSMPLHGGCSYFKAVCEDGNVVSFKVGGDYSHYHDDLFLDMATAEHATTVFYDAAELAKHLDGAHSLAT